MTQDFNPKDMIAYADKIAHEMVEEMPDDEAILMVRDFIRVLAEWQPAVHSKIGEPTMLAITALSTTRLFELAFLKAYSYSEKHVAAREAIEKVFGEQS